MLEQRVLEKMAFLNPSFISTADMETSTDEEFFHAHIGLVISTLSFFYLILRHDACVSDIFVLMPRNHGEQTDMLPMSIHRALYTSHNMLRQRHAILSKKNHANREDMVLFSLEQSLDRIKDKLQVDTPLSMETR